MNESANQYQCQVYAMYVLLVYKMCYNPDIYEQYLL